MEKERCDNCLYEYACDWRKAGEELRCEDCKVYEDFLDDADDFY